MTGFTLLSITDAAVEHLLKSLEHLNNENGSVTHVRLSILGKGCSGFKYDWTYDEQNDDDITIPLDNTANLIVGSKLAPRLEGAIIDLVAVNAFTKEIKIINPNEGTRCGCGKSYS